MKTNMTDDSGAATLSAANSEELNQTVGSDRARKIVLAILLFVPKMLWAIRGLIYLILFFCFIFWGIPRVQEFVLNFKLKNTKDQIADEKTMLAYTEDLNKVSEKLKIKFTGLTPRSTYMVINSTENEFFVYKDRELIREGKCSTGSYIMLKSGDKKEWIFKTPKGMLTVKGKITNPVWKKPDWAFVEEGLPIPSPNHPSRYEYGVLGDYALSLGDGYMLHGTLYKRFIGLPVTHGCVRLGDDDLKFIYNSLSVGSKVIIY
jgi:L,D-transpeptidase ErfK/SrfK